MKHFNIRITGKVQGVFFRAFTKQKADELGVLGFVRNERDGSVYIEAEGEDGQLASFAKWCERGPANARVETCKTEEKALKHYKRFEIQR